MAKASVQTYWLFKAREAVPASFEHHLVIYRLEMLSGFGIVTEISVPGRRYVVSGH